MFALLGYVTAALVGGTALAGLLVALLWPAPRVLDLTGKHVVISGGSKGLGLALARLCAARGARLTLLARDPGALALAQAALPAGRVSVRAVDVCDQPAVAHALRAAQAELGPIACVVTCAGAAHPGLFLDLAPEVFRRQMDVNYLGTVHVVHEAVRLMIDSGTRGEVVCVSSSAALVGIAGYSAYCPSKYAVRGFAETLRNELIPHGIAVRIYYPPTMDTEGLKEENKLKPAVTHAIEGTSEMLSAEKAAEVLLAGMQRGEFAITGELGGYLLRVGSSGIAPKHNVFLESLMAWPLAFISTGFQLHFDHIVRTSHKRAAAKGKAQ